MTSTTSSTSVPSVSSAHSATSASSPASPTSGGEARPNGEAARLLRLLTPREAQALAGLAAGDDTRAVARALGIAPGTARTHLHRAMRKLGVRTREDAAEVVRLLRGPLPVLPVLPAGGHLPHAVRLRPSRRPAVPLPPSPSPSPSQAAAVDRAPVTFAALCADAHERLVRQTYLVVTGRRRRAVRCVHRALGAAARHWRTVSALPDPEGWVRAYAFEAALSPWRRGGPRRVHVWRLPRRRIRVRPASTEPPEPRRPTSRDRALLRALRRLSRPQRRALVLHGMAGLSVGEVAVEVESSTAAAEGRVLVARAALARSVPGLVGPDPLEAGFGERLGELLRRAAEHGCRTPRRPIPVLLRVRGWVRSGLATAAAALLTLAMGAAVVGTLAGGGPSDYFRPVAPAAPPLCSTTDTGSAGPAVAGGLPGVRSQWCAATPPPPVAAPG